MKPKAELNRRGQGENPGTKKQSKYGLLAQLRAFEAAPRPKRSAYGAKGGIKSKGPGFPETKKT